MRFQFAYLRNTSKIRRLQHQLYTSSRTSYAITWIFLSDGWKIVSDDSFLRCYLKIGYLVNIGSTMLLNLWYVTFCFLWLLNEAAAECPSKTKRFQEVDSEFIEVKFEDTLYSPVSYVESIYWEEFSHSRSLNWHVFNRTSFIWLLFIWTKFQWTFDCTNYCSLNSFICFFD